MNSVDKQYFDLIRYIKEYGVEKLDRTGTGTKSIFSYDMRFNMKEGFPLLTSKKMAWKAMVIELLWFLKGDTNIKYLVDNGCMIWVGDALKNFNKHIDEENAKMSSDPLLMYQPKARWTREEFIEKIKTDDKFAEKWGELGPVYGKQWRSWKYYKRGNKLLDIPGWEDKDWDFHTEHGEGELDNIGEFRIFDQIANLINDLKTNPDSRRLMVNSWNVGEIEQMVLPPCHYGFQCYTRELTTEERNKWYFNTSYQNPKYKVDWKDYELDQQNVPKRALSLKFNMRSVDVPLGLPFNIASYGLLLHLLAKEVNMFADELIFSGGDCHIYLNQMEGITKQLHQKTYSLPTIEISNKSIFDISYEDIKLLNYQSADKNDMPLSN